jgi:heme-degrading monooxygenase HmoA
MSFDLSAAREWQLFDYLTRRDKFLPPGADAFGGKRELGWNAIHLEETHMLLERAELQIKEGQEEAFTTTMQSQGVPLLRGVPGVLSVNFGRGVENPGKFMLLVEWQSLEAHAAFNKSPASPQLRALIGPHSKGGAMEHFRMG